MHIPEPSPTCSARIFRQEHLGPGHSLFHEKSTCEDVHEAGRNSRQCSPTSRHEGTERGERGFRWRGQSGSGIG